MTTWNPKLWRFAVRLRAAYAAADRGDSPFLPPEDDWRRLRRLAACLETAENRRWSQAANQVRTTLLSELERLGERLRDGAAGLRAAERRRLPTVRLLYDELLATEEEFGELAIDGPMVSVTTEPIVLEGIPLGPFRIRLDAERPDGGNSYTVAALKPNPTASSDEITHPHVNGERLCAGEGRAAITAALAEGRLMDFFQVVNRILHTYAEGAAYVELSRWHGVPCRDCADLMDEDDACVCRGCDESLCADCYVGCGSCGDGYCSGCLERCARCEQGYCGRCLAACLRCRERHCESCLDENVCTSCWEDWEHAEEPPEETRAADAAAAEPAI